MITHSIVVLALTTAIATAPVAQVDNWTDIGDYRISCYCKWCNEPQGTGSKSGKPLTAGHVATQDLPIGTKIAIEGEEYEVTDTCGVPGTIDIYVENDSGYCRCNTLDYKTVYMEEE